MHTILSYHSIDGGLACAAPVAEEIEIGIGTVEETPSIYMKPLHFSHGSPAGSH